MKSPEIYFCEDTGESLLTPNIGDIVVVKTPTRQHSDGIDWGFSEYKVFGAENVNTSTASITIPRDISDRFGSNAFTYYAKLTTKFSNKSIGVEVDMINDKKFLEMFKGYDLNGCLRCVFIYKRGIMEKVYVEYSNADFLEFTYETLSKETFEIARSIHAVPRTFLFEIENKNVDVSRSNDNDDCTLDHNENLCQSTQSVQGRNEERAGGAADCFAYPFKGDRENMIRILKEINEKCSDNVYVDITQNGNFIAHVFFAPYETRLADFFKNFEKTGFYNPRAFEYTENEKMVLQSVYNWLKEEPLLINNGYHVFEEKF